MGFLSPLALPVPPGKSLELLAVLAETAGVRGGGWARDSFALCLTLPYESSHLRCFGLAWTVLMTVGIGCSMLWKTGHVLTPAVPEGQGGLERGPCELG